MIWDDQEEERQKIDPELRYSSVEGRTTLESIALEILELLPDAEVQRTQDVIQLNWGGELGLVVLVTVDAIEFRRPAIEWTGGSYGPALTSRLLRRVKLGRDRSQVDLSQVLAGVLELHRSKLRQCRFCERTFLPERMHGRNVCHGCAEQHLGVVH